MKLGAKSRLQADTYGLVFHITEKKFLPVIDRKGLTLNQKPQGQWEGKIVYERPSIFVTKSNRPSVQSEVMQMILSKRWSLEEWGEWDDKDLDRVGAEYVSLSIDLSLVPGAKLYPDPLKSDDPKFKVLHVPVPPEAILARIPLWKGWRDA